MTQAVKDQETLYKLIIRYAVILLAYFLSVNVYFQFQHTFIMHFVPYVIFLFVSSRNLCSYTICDNFYTKSRALS